MAIIFSLSLALFAGNALAAGGKSSKAYKNDKQSSKHSEKSVKGPKSSKPGNGYGHCKSDKSGKGHSKKKGNGHDRDDDCGGGGGGGGGTCSASVTLFEDFDTVTAFSVDENVSNQSVQVIASVSWVGQVCSGDADLSSYLSPITYPAINLGPAFPIGVPGNSSFNYDLKERICEFNGADPILEYDDVTFSYPVNIELTCAVIGGN